MEFKGSNIFLNIPINIARDQVLLDKTPKGILLMGEIVSMLNVTGKFFMSNAEMAKRLRVSQSTVKNYLDLLEERGYIVRKIIYKENSKQIVGREITLGQSAGLGWGNVLTQGRPTTKPRVGQPTDHKKNNIKEQKNRTDKDIGQAEPDDIPYKEIIDYLNKKTNRPKNKYFKASSKTNRKLIHARWKEGYRLKDFKEVINNKCFSWMNNPEMFDYLRPSTLFGPKFDQYLKEMHIPSNATPYDLKDFENQKLPQDDDLPF